MKRGVLVAAIVAIAVLGAAGWWFVGRSRSGGALRPRAAEVAVRWRGKQNGAMRLPARLNWCPGMRRGILEAISGDSGIAVILYERDSLTGVPHTVVSPEMAQPFPTPGAVVVLRWMRISPDTTVAGFRSQSGLVRVTFRAGTGSGDFNVRMRSATNLDTLTLVGEFRDVPVVTTAAGCN